MSGPTGGHVVFAANLRRLCNSTTSIADICRDTGINRQQFNKYLAGRSVPSARVLRKICQRLGVSETVLLGNHCLQMVPKKAPAQVLSPLQAGWHGSLTACSFYSCQRPSP